MKKVATLPNYYSTIEELTLYRWDKYCQTKDNNWFLVDYDGRQKKIDIPELKEIEDSLIEQYFKAIDDRSFSLKIQKWAKIDCLKTKYQIVDSLLHFMWLGFGNDKKEQEQRCLIIAELKKWGFKFPELNSVEADKSLIIDYRKALEGIKTQIGIISNELQADGKKEKKSLQRQISFVETFLKIPIDERKISLARWIAYWQDINEKAKQN